MSVYVGIDVHRKRSQVAVVDEGGGVQVNRNVPNGVEPVLQVIGDLPVGTPVAFEAAFGWGWLVELLEDLHINPTPAGRNPHAPLSSPPDHPPPLVGVQLVRPRPRSFPSRG